MGLLGSSRQIGRCRAAFKQVSAAAAAVFWKQPLYAHREKKENAVKKKLLKHRRTSQIWPLMQFSSVSLFVRQVTDDPVIGQDIVLFNSFQ